MIADRPAIELDGDWEIVPDPDRAFDSSRVPGGRAIRVPSCWDELFGPAAPVVTAWYRRSIDVPAEWGTDRALLRFGAVSYACEAWLNGTAVGGHEGAYTPFTVGCGGALRAGAPNELLIRVTNPANAIEHYPAFSRASFDAARARVPELPVTELPIGKQTWYSSLSGIWRSVRLERVAPVAIEKIAVRPDARQGQATVSWALTSDPSVEASERLTIEMEVRDASGEIAGGAETAVAGRSSGETEVALSQPRLWDLDSPHLYTLSVRLRQAGEARDGWSARFGLRTIETAGGEIRLNGKPIRVRGILDQELYEDSLWTPPGPDTVRRRLEAVAAMGLNLVRCHIKVPDSVYLDTADELGLLVWSELPSWTDLTVASERRAREQLSDIVDAIEHHPSVVIWSVVNESWGVPVRDGERPRRFLRETFDWLKARDPGRLIVDNSPAGPPIDGDFHVRSDIADYHVYFALPGRAPDVGPFVSELAGRPPWLWSPHGDAEELGDEPIILSEFGNWGLPDPRGPSDTAGAAPWWFETGIGPARPEGFARRFEELGLDRIWPDIDALATATQWQEFEALQLQVGEVRRHDALAGFVVTELTDEAWEANGVLDFSQQPKAFHDRLVDLFGPVAVFADLERFDVWAGDGIRVPIHIADGTARPRRGAHIAWALDLDDRINADGTLTVDVNTRPWSCPDLELVVPDVDAVTDGRLRLQLQAGERTLCRQDYTLRIVPRDTSMPRPAIPDAVVVSDGLTSAAVDAASAGANVLAVVDSRSPRAEPPAALERPLTIRPRDAVAGDGVVDWNFISSFDWTRPGVFAGWPPRSLLDLACQEIVPDRVLHGATPDQIRNEVSGGSFSGWVGTPTATIWSFQQGRGRLTVTTLRVLRATGPIATVARESLVRVAANALPAPV